jgi:hypothetical protein
MDALSIFGAGLKVHSIQTNTAIRKWKIKMAIEL